MTKPFAPRPGAVVRLSRCLVLTALLFMFIAGAVDARDAITGRVVDSDGNPIVGATVMTNINGVGTVTDDDGYFTLPDRDGIKWVTLSSIGFRSRQLSVGKIDDSLELERQYYRGTDILVTADRADPGHAPVAFENFSKNEIVRDYTVGEFPLLLNTTTNLHSYSDGGAPLGYSYMRLRGFDDKRVRTYINGVPLNDPEDQATYFVDLPDFAANVSDIQIQRGVGNSLYGDASFGGSINIVTDALAQPREAKVVAGYGEFTSDGERVSDIYKQSVEYATGLIDGRWAFSGRFSKQKTGGYRDNSWYEGWSYYFSAARLDPNMSTELHVYGGPIRMHLSYWGIPSYIVDTNRRFNPLTYSNETDNFNQPHYHLHNTWRVNEKTTLQNTLYYIRGKGYYEQFMSGVAFDDYGIAPSQRAIDTATGTPYDSTSLVQQQHVEKNQLGWNPRLDIDHDRGRHSFGGSVYYFTSDHWGLLPSVSRVNNEFVPRKEYYKFYGDQWVGSIYAQEYYRLTDKLSTQLTAQLRYETYEMDQVERGAYGGYDFDLDWLYFSPRIGLTYEATDRLNLFTHFAVSSRTPTLFSIFDAGNPNAFPSLQVDNTILSAGGNDTTFVFGDPTARSERILNLELGGRYRAEQYALGLNFFWMDFTDEIIPYGGLNPNLGIPVTVNADRSVHAGIEFNGAVQPIEWLRIDGNLAYNYNRILKYEAFVDTLLVDFEDKTISGFPDVLGNLIVDYRRNDVRLTYAFQAVGKQYMELYNIEDLAIDAYTVSSLTASYTFRTLPELGNITLRASVNNLFDQEYLTSGYGGNYLDGGGAVTGWADYYPGPERWFYGQIELELY